MNRKLSIAALVTATALALTGCSINIGGNDSDDGMMGGGMNHSHSSGNFSGADIMFAQMMISHHQQAVDMGTLAETRALSSKVKKLADQIKAEQSPEIEQMKGWLTSAGASMDMGHEMGMGGMLSDADMEKLKNAKGAEFDRLYLERMIEHHKGAIHMAQMVVDSSNAEAAKLGKAIIDSQTKQISYMQSLLKK